ncbi:hypothetical protein ANANG_G00209250, partial [Anguilla anguilla]
MHVYHRRVYIFITDVEVSIMPNTPFSKVVFPAYPALCGIWIEIIGRSPFLRDVCHSLYTRLLGFQTPCQTRPSRTPSFVRAGQRTRCSLGLRENSLSAHRPSLFIALLPYVCFHIDCAVCVILLCVSNVCYTLVCEYCVLYSSVSTVCYTPV